MRAERGITNVSFQKGDVEARLPFGIANSMSSCAVSRCIISRAAEGGCRDGRVCRARRNGGGRGFDCERTAGSRRVLQRVRAVARHLAYRALAMSEMSDDARRGARDCAIHVGRIRQSGVAWIKAANASPDRRQGDCDGRAGRGGRSERRESRRIDGEMYFTYRIAMLVTRKLG